MKKSLYILKEGVIYKKGNTIYYQNKEVKKALPINGISEIFCYSKTTIKSGAAFYLMSLGIPIHFFNKFGFYVGSLYPRDYLIAGKILVLQAEHYLNINKRMEIAKEIVRGIQHNILVTLKYYNRRGKEVYSETIEKVDIDGSKSISELLSTEAKIWENYYNSFNTILKEFEFDKRTRRPPQDEINAMISFGNSLLYSVCLTEIYNTYLSPAISFLHEPSERRYSLALDISELFKPLFTGRTIFSLVNKNIITDEHFEKIQEGVFLNEQGKRIFLKEFDEKMNTTITYPPVRRKVTYRRLIRFECYKLIKHFLGNKSYESFKMWW